MTADLRKLLEYVQRDAPLPWQWWTSNSMRRLSSNSGKDGDVAHAYRATDGVPDISITTHRQELIVAAVNALPDLLGIVEAAQRYVVCESQVTKAVKQIDVAGFKIACALEDEALDALTAALAQWEKQ